MNQHLENTESPLTRLENNMNHHVENTESPLTRLENNMNHHVENTERPLTRLENNMNQHVENTESPLIMNKNEVTAQFYECVQREKQLQRGHGYNIEYNTPGFETKTLKVRELQNMTVMDLRKVARSMHFRLRNLENKSELIEMINSRSDREGILNVIKMNAPNILNGKETGKVDRNTMPRLINIIFSSHFCDRVVGMSSKVNRDGLNVGFLNDFSQLWQDIATAFNTSDDEQYALVLVDPIQREDPLFSNLLPRLQRKFPPKKLECCWKEVVRKFKQCLANFHRSTQGDPDFFTFCQNQVPIYYLWCWLQLKPSVISFVGGRLPPKVLRLERKGTITRILPAPEMPRDSTGTGDSAGTKRSGGCSETTHKRKPDLNEINEIRKDLLEWISDKKQALDQERKKDEQASAVFQYQSVLQSIKLVREQIQQEQEKTFPDIDNILLESFKRDLISLFAKKDQLAKLAFS